MSLLLTSIICSFYRILPTSSSFFCEIGISPTKSVEIVLFDSNVSCADKDCSDVLVVWGVTLGDVDVTLLLVYVPLECEGTYDLVYDEEYDALDECEE